MRSDEIPAFYKLCKAEELVASSAEAASVDVKEDGEIALNDKGLGLEVRHVFLKEQPLHLRR